MTSQFRWPVPACARHARSVLACLGIIALLATLARGDTIGLNSYDQWQWNGFSRSSPHSTLAPFSSSLFSVLTSSNSSLILPMTTVTPALAWDAVNAASSSSGAAILAGVVYYDADGDGIRDNSDWGIPDAVVTITASDNTTVATVVTDSNGKYLFTGLAADTYTITLLTPSSQPDAPTLGTLLDSGGNVITAGSGFVAGPTSITSIEMPDGGFGVNYDFGQLMYPSELVSKRMLLNVSPGVYHTSAIPVPVPEPGTLVLLAMVGLPLAGFVRWCRSCVR